MDRDTAVDIANDWNDNGGRELGRHYDRLLTLLLEYGPEQVDAWGSERRPDGLPRALVLAGDVLLVAHVEGEHDAAVVTLHSVPLDPAKTRVRLVERTEQNQAIVDVHHHWVFELPDGEVVLEVRTVRHRGSAFDDGPPSAERLARTLARRLGWETPDR